MQYCNTLYIYINLNYKEEKTIYTNIKSPLGEITVAAKDGYIIGLCFLNQKYYNAKVDLWDYDPKNEIFKSLELWIDKYFSGKNPISIIIPCHRVLGQNGSLTGYAGRIQKKKALLKLENIKIDNKTNKVKL